MAKKLVRKDYRLTSGKFHFKYEGGESKCFRKGDGITLTVAQAEKFADLIEPAKDAEKRTAKAIKAREAKEAKEAADREAYHEEATEDSEVPEASEPSSDGSEASESSEPGEPVSEDEPTLDV